MSRGRGAALMCCFRPGTVAALLAILQAAPSRRRRAASRRSASDRRLGPGPGSAFAANAGPWARRAAACVIAAAITTSRLVLMPACLALACFSSSAPTAPAGLPSRSTRQAPMSTRFEVARRAAIHRERANEFGPSNGAAERGEEVGVDADLERPSARVRHGEALRKLCGQHRYERFGSLALFRHSPRPRAGCICTTSHDNRATVSMTNGRSDRTPDVADNTLIFAKPQALG